MGRKLMQQMQQAKKSGLTPADVARIHAMARKHAEAMEIEATEKAFLYMLAIPLNVLVNDYWSKTAKRRAPKFIEDVISLYQSVEDGVVTEKELAGLLKEYAGITVNPKWLEKIAEKKKNAE